MRKHGKIDGNHKAVVDALRAAGASVLSLASLGKGAPDILVGYRSLNYTFEIKDGSKPLSKKQLTPLELMWMSSWKGQATIVYSPQDALNAIGAPL